jgi:hypothetical protein
MSDRATPPPARDLILEIMADKENGSAQVVQFKKAVESEKKVKSRLKKLAAWKKGIYVGIGRRRQEDEKVRNSSGALWAQAQMKTR